MKVSGNSYRNILKGTSIFGGVQIFNILINLIRGKFVAVILGPEGMGIASLFTSASNTVQRFSSLGLNQSIVRETAAADENGQNRGPVIATTLRLLTLTSLLGALICVIFCVPLSRLTFGDSGYAWQFMLLGVAVGFGIAGSGKLAILQGLHQVRKISKASIVGGLTGLFIGVPLYYIFGYKGIVPAIVAVAFSMYLFYSISLRKCAGNIPSAFSLKDSIPVARKIIMLGIVLMASDLIGSLVIYLINLFLRYFGSIDDVGLYQAANSVTNQYAGLVFAAMAMDYFPRLSKVSDSNLKMKVIVNRQAEIVAFLIGPAMCLLILSAPLVIRILLSSRFLEIIPLMRWFGLGVLMKALSYPMGYIALAKGNKKIFFLLEGIAGNLLYLFTACIFFYFFGLIGLGYALVSEQLIILIIYYIVNRRLYGYHFSRGALIASLTAIIFGTATFIVSLIQTEALAYTLMSLTSVLSLLWAFLSLKSRLKQ